MHIYNSTFHSRWFTQICRLGTGSEVALMVCPMRASRCRLAWNAQGPWTPVGHSLRIDPRWVEWQKLSKQSQPYEGLQEADPHVNDSWFILRLHLFPNDFHPVRIYEWWIHHLDCRCCHAYRWVWIEPTDQSTKLFRMPLHWCKIVASNHGNMTAPLSDPSRFFLKA